MNNHQINAISFWGLAMLSLLGLTIFAYVEVFNVLLQQPADSTKLSEIHTELNAYGDITNDIRIVYMLICFAPLVFLLLFKHKVWKWISTGLIAILTLVNSLDALEHLMEGEWIFSIVFLILVSGLGLLSLIFSIKWAKEAI